MNKKLESTEAVHTHTHTHTTHFTEKINKAKNNAFIKDIYITDQLLI